MTKVRRTTVPHKGFRDLEWFLTIPTPPKPTRATYEARRLAELDRIRRLDATRREFFNVIRPLGPHGDFERWADERVTARELADHRKAEYELQEIQRDLAHAVEVYLRGCVARASLTGRQAVEQAGSPDDLVAQLQWEEDEMIAIFGPPWEQEGSPDNRRPNLNMAAGRPADDRRT
jgi:hypothetical protein